MQQIKTLSPAAYEWLNEFPLEKWTMYKDGSRTWSAMTTDVSESYNGVLKISGASCDCHGSNDVQSSL